MSETGRKMDVEDVLSSIRRLVSEEARGAQDTANPASSPRSTVAETPQDRPANAPEKLVLTPSLRVTEALSPTPVAADIEQRIADIESLVMSEAVESGKAEIDRAVDVQMDEDASDLPHPDDKSDLNGSTARMAEMVEIIEDDQFDADAAKQKDSAPEAVNPDDMMAALHLSMRDFTRVEPPLTANLSKAPQSDPAVSDPAVSDPIASDDADDTSPSVSEAIEGIVNFDFVESKRPADDLSENDADDDAISAQDDLSEADFPTDSPFEDIMDEDDEDEERADFHAAPLRATPSGKETVIERETNGADTQAELKQTSDPRTFAKGQNSPLFEEPIDYTDGEDGFLDEESLREMVSEMVRSELQGELGDRITRNVRKLVRREIYRALASREFE